MRQLAITKCGSSYFYKVRELVITKCDSYFVTNCDKCYYKGRQVLQSVTILLQSATGITKCVDYNKVRQSQTLLDLVLTNSKLRVLQAGVSNPHVSDHALVYAILRVFSPKCRSQKICFRSMKNFDVDKFCDDLNYAPFVTVMNSFEDVNDKLFAFESMYTSILDEHAPMKTVRVRGNQVPFMNDEWRKAIRYRNRLWKVFTKDRSDANYAAYKYQRNICTSLRRRAIKTYFRKISDEMNQDPRQF